MGENTPEHLKKRCNPLIVLIKWSLILPATGVASGVQVFKGQPLLVFLWDFRFYFSCIFPLALRIGFEIKKRMISFLGFMFFVRSFVLVFLY